MSEILLVEDEEHLARGLKFNLEAEGYPTRVVGDGETALDLLLKNHHEFDLLVLDVMLPGKDGFAVAAELRKANQYIPVLMLTARGRPEDVLKGFASGADDYLAKPFELPELLARIRALIRRAAGNATAAVTIGEVTVDLSGHTVTQRGAPVALTAREITLIEFLVQHRGRVVPRERLYEHLFDENESSLSNLLDVHIFNIRKKLGHDLISTRRRLGYCIE